MNVRRVELDWARDKAREKGVRTVDTVHGCVLCARATLRGEWGRVCVCGNSCVKIDDQYMCLFCIDKRCTDIADTRGELINFIASTDRA